MTPAAVLLADSDTGKGSPIGLLVVLLLVIAVYFLWRSMNRHLKKVEPPADGDPRQSWPSSPDQPAAGRDDPDRIENRPDQQG